MKRAAKAVKGAELEEVLRRYFLRAGYFVIRGVPFRLADEDGTDVDLWMYERSLGITRRVQICDVKYKQRPKAVERILWTRGLMVALDADGAFIATTDSRPALKELSKRVGVQLIDGEDVKKIQENEAESNVRITDEELIAEIRLVDATARGKFLQEARNDIISALTEGFGRPSAVRAIEAFSKVATFVVRSRPGADAANLSVRLSLIAAALFCVSIDFVSAESALRPIEERKQSILDAIRLGAMGGEEGRKSLEMALMLVGRYSANGPAAARAIQKKLDADLERIPADIVTDQAMKLIRANKLFDVAIELEVAAYSRDMPLFDSLSIQARAILGSMLDYSSLDRGSFAGAFQKAAGGVPPNPSSSGPIVDSAAPQAPLFGDALTSKDGGDA